MRDESTGRHVLVAAECTEAGAQPIARDEAEPADRPWRGGFEGFSVGDPGRAASRVVPIPDPEIRYRPDTIVDGLTLPGQDRRPVVHLRAASVRGLAHRAYGTVRQDQYAFRTARDGRFLVLCVADGVSAGRLSHLAAVWATRQGTDELVNLLADADPELIDWERFLTGLADVIDRQGRHHLEAADRDGSPSRREVAEAMATTVLYGIVDLRDAAAAFPVHLVGVGDTSGWVLRAGEWHPQQAVKNAGAEIHTSAVVALPMLPRALPAPVRTEIRPGEALVLMTDGVGDPLGDGTGAVGEFLGEVWQRPPHDLEFAAHVAFTRRSYDDDRTVVAVWPIARP